MKIAPFVLLLLPALSAAQVVYRCETGGKIAYSDAPCVGAKVIDAMPNQGVDQMAGKSRKGSDVRRTELNHAFDDALRPLTGKSRAEMDVMRRRVKLEPHAQGECRRLDSQLAEQASVTKNAVGAASIRADVALYQARKRYFDLKC